MSFNFQCGDRPLEGFTIKRGVGIGGFGEVYLAVSDGGKIAALKWIRNSNDREVERRGALAVLNLKHPNLVTLYDLRVDSRDDTWVVMEYMFGETLASLIARHKRGMPLELVRECFISMAEAIRHLHEHGIVHRDLKPGNVFLENSIVKVGDYGLSKSIGAGLHRGHTERIGTCQYMAPEIASGRYDKNVDIYALGVILYEMLSGCLPYDGEDLVEILRKQMQSTPDLSRVLDARFHPILKKALAQDKNGRYESVQAMLEEFKGVFGSAVTVQQLMAPASVTGPIPALKVGTRIKYEVPLVLFFSTLGSLIWVFGLRILQVVDSYGKIMIITIILTSLYSSTLVFVGTAKWYRKASNLVKKAIMMGVGLVAGFVFQESLPGIISAKELNIIPAWYMAAMLVPDWANVLGKRRRARINPLATLKAFGWVVLVGMAIHIRELQWGVPVLGAIWISQLVAPWKKRTT
jgi:serine/threonine protein kinase